ncbi:MAG: YggS family pyridoxal phosphate-dependent enzyme [Lachnospiraceae bacterium]|nr:YggS family pyridoxal phosphate-dependent enzyme [Lachnospiraceae bacterium]
MSLIDNYNSVSSRLSAAYELGKSAGTAKTEPVLIAVSKTHPASDIQELYDAGVRVFGENKVQELCEKEEILPKDIEWHLIGHLQRNKVKYIVGKVALIHSVDSLRLAEEISKEAGKAGVTCDILLEVNVAEEESKFGISTAETEELARQISVLPGVRIRGLMTIAPFVENPEENRVYFRKLRELSVDIAGKNIDNVYMDVLSMGMTGDFEVAAQEGATFVRVGTAIFGQRSYPV